MSCLNTGQPSGYLPTAIKAEEICTRFDSFLVVKDLIPKVWCVCTVCALNHLGSHICEYFAVVESYYLF